MATAKRIYLYVVSAVGLGLILSGAATLVRLILRAAGAPTGALLPVRGPVVGPAS